MELRLDELMRKHRINQAQLAAALGVARPTVNAWLAGQSKKGERITVFPAYPVLERLCHFFQVTPNDLLHLAPTPADGLTVENFDRPARPIGGPPGSFPPPGLRSVDADV